MTITIDNEFKNLIPPLTAEEYAGLEQSIIEEGCRDALITWNGILIDGHNRYEICTKHNIDFETREFFFDSRNDVIVWIIKNQFGRRNLPAYERARLALRLKPVIAEKAKAQQVRTEENRVCQISDKQAIDTKKELAKAAGVSHDTIVKVEKIEAIATPEVKEQLRKGEMSINQAYQSIQQPHVSFNSGNNEWYTPEDYIEAARAVMGSIDFDPASSEIANKIVKAAEYYTAETNGLDKQWRGNVWMNPPYASDLIGLFIDKLLQELPNIEQAIILVNNATETEWFYKLISKAGAVCFPRSRVKFYMPDGKTGAPLQGQAVLYYGNNRERFVDVFREKGWCAIPQ